MHLKLGDRMGECQLFLKSITKIISMTTKDLNFILSITLAIGHKTERAEYQIGTMMNAFSV